MFYGPDSPPEDEFPCWVCGETGLTPEGMEVWDRIEASGHKVPEAAILRRYPCPCCSGVGQTDKISAKRYYNDYVRSED